MVLLEPIALQQVWYLFLKAYKETKMLNNSQFE